MSITALNGKSQATVLSYMFGLGTVAYLAAYFFVGFIQQLANNGWYAAVPLWIACVAASYPLAYFAALGATTCTKCGMAWVKHQVPGEEIMQVFPRTDTSGQKVRRYEVTRYRVFHDCDHCGHQTHKDKERSRLLA